MRGFLIGLVGGVAGGWLLASAVEEEISWSDAHMVVARLERMESEAEATPPPAPGEAPAYMLVLGDVHDRAAFGQGYAAKLPPLYERFGGEYIAIGSDVEKLEGDLAPQSYVIGKWPSKSAALAFWNSPEYDELRRARIDGNWGTFDVLLVQGLPAPAKASPSLVVAPE